MSVIREIRQLSDVRLHGKPYVRNSECKFHFGRHFKSRREITISIFLIGQYLLVENSIRINDVAIVFSIFFYAIKADTVAAEILITPACIIFPKGQSW